MVADGATGCVGIPKIQFSIEVEGVDFELNVYADYSKPEPSVGHEGGWSIDRVEFCASGEELPRALLGLIECEILDRLEEWNHEPDYAGDYYDSLW